MGRPQTSADDVRYLLVDASHHRLATANSLRPHPPTEVEERSQDMGGRRWVVMIVGHKPGTTDADKGCQSL